MRVKIYICEIQSDKGQEKNAKSIDNLQSDVFRFSSEHEVTSIQWMQSSVSLGLNCINTHITAVISYA